MIFSCEAIKVKADVVDRSYIDNWAAKLSVAEEGIWFRSEFIILYLSSTAYQRLTQTSAKSTDRFWCPFVEPPKKDTKTVEANH